LSRKKRKREANVAAATQANEQKEHLAKKAHVLKVSNQQLLLEQALLWKQCESLASVPQAVLPQDLPTQEDILAELQRNIPVPSHHEPMEIAVRMGDVGDSSSAHASAAELGSLGSGSGMICSCKEMEVAIQDTLWLILLAVAPFMLVMLWSDVFVTVLSNTKHITPSTAQTVRTLTHAGYLMQVIFAVLLARSGIRDHALPTSVTMCGCVVSLPTIKKMLAVDLIISTIYAFIYFVIAEGDPAAKCMGRDPKIADHSYAHQVMAVVFDCSHGLAIHVLSTSITIFFLVVWTLTCQYTFDVYYTTPDCMADVTTSGEERLAIDVAAEKMAAAAKMRTVHCDTGMETGASQEQV